MSNATRVIRGLGLTVNRSAYILGGEIRFGVRRVPSSETPGTVLRQHPSPGTRVPPGALIRLVVAAPQPGPCDPSYPNVCIPPPPPDLNCDDLPFNNITVVGSDLHELDGYDNDGIGCET